MYILKKQTTTVQPLRLAEFVTELEDTPGLHGVPLHPSFRHEILNIVKLYVEAFLNPGTYPPAVYLCNDFICMQYIFNGRSAECYNISHQAWMERMM